MNSWQENRYLRCKVPVPVMGQLGCRIARVNHIRGLRSAVQPNTSGEFPRLRLNYMVALESLRRRRRCRITHDC